MGGGHYSPKLTTVMLETEWAIGHIIPKYAFPVEESMLRQAMEKTEGAEAVIMDWKGTPARSSYHAMAESMGMKVIKTKDF
jgi:D-aminoacyl-tRNA deacylase